MKELSLNILDITQNSIKAGAKLISIILDENRIADRLALTIDDNGCGMDETTLVKVADPFYTSRTTRSVGLGLPFLKMQAEMTGGDFSITSQVGVGTTVKASFLPSSIDFTPLGDLISTVITLVQGSPELDFIFSHTITDASIPNGKTEIHLSTAEIREVLGDEVSLAEQDVLDWIKGSLDEMYAG